MKVLLAPDSFKGSLSAPEVCSAMRRGIHAVDPAVVVDLLPLADGGEGTLEAIAQALQVQTEKIVVKGPLGHRVEASVGFSRDRRLAVMDMASASGLALVAPAERNPLRASSFGTGELLAHALDAGVDRIILGIGGSAVNDAGAGMLQALGFLLLDAEGRSLPEGAESLTRLHRIDRSQVHPRLHAVALTVACDVVNPLLGESGATRTYGPQKGATPEMLPLLEAALAHFADCVEELVRKNFRSHAGAGAAGGMGFSLLSLLNAELRSGFELIADVLGLREHLLRENYDWLLTGEGRIDEQSSQGKLLQRLGRLGLETQTPIVAFAGSLSAQVPELPGIEHIFPIQRAPCDLAEAMRDADVLLFEAVKRVMKLLLFGTKR